MSYCWNTLRWRNAVCVISLNLLAARTVEGVQNGDVTEPECLGLMMSNAGHFMYFAFGSNLLKERLQLNNPSAVFHCLGRLKVTAGDPDAATDYCLTFGFTEEQFDNRWHGGVATIEESKGTDVWGVIWKMSKDNLNSLDKQEAVDIGMYSPLEVMVETDMGAILCRTYRMNKFRASPPSPQYKEVVCLGAQQNGLPPDYIKRLEAVHTNNYAGPSILDEIKKAMK